MWREKKRNERKQTRFAPVFAPPVFCAAPVRRCAGAPGRRGTNNKRCTLGAGTVKITQLPKFAGLLYFALHGLTPKCSTAAAVVLRQSYIIHTSLCGITRADSFEARLTSASYFPWCLGRVVIWSVDRYVAPRPRYNAGKGLTGITGRGDGYRRKRKPVRWSYAELQPAVSVSALDAPSVPSRGYGERQLHFWSVGSVHKTQTSKLRPRWGFELKI